MSTLVATPVSADGGQSQDASTPDDGSTPTPQEEPTSDPVGGFHAYQESNGVVAVINATRESSGHTGGDTGGSHADDPDQPEQPREVVHTNGDTSPEPETFTDLSFRGEAGEDNACIAHNWFLVGTQLSLAGEGDNFDTAVHEHLNATGGTVPPPCNPPPIAATPADPAAPAPAGPSAADLLAAAQVYIDTIVPPPGLGVEPPNGEGFVAVPVLVQLARDPSFAAPPRTVTLFGTDYTLTADLAATTTIDWGDGETTTGVTSQGATYDQVHGDLHDERLIRHVYINDGPVDITATDTWTVTLTLQGVGTITVPGIALAETATIDIVELQAVVTQ